MSESSPLSLSKNGNSCRCLECVLFETDDDSPLSDCFELVTKISTFDLGFRVVLPGPVCEDDAGVGRKD